MEKKRQRESNRDEEKVREREGAGESDAKWGKLRSIGATEKHWDNEQIVDEQL